jgi:hypothetical protein
MARDDDDDYDDAPRRSGGGAKGPLDGMFANTNIVILIIFAICCGYIAVVLALICFLTAKDPKAKANAKLVLIIDAVLIVINIIVYATVGFGAIMGGGAR